MKFIRSNDSQLGSNALAGELVNALAENKKVLWLVSGGSNILATKEIMDRIAPELTAQLTIAPIDERYGPVGHADSNWQQLLSGGFDPKAARTLPVLEPDLDLEATRLHFTQIITPALQNSDFVIALLGIGPDGHTAGILPNSPACRETDAYVSAYESSPYTRITLTFPALQRIHKAYVFAFGEAKLPTLQQLQSEDVDLATQPAQILKALPDVYIYNDQIGEAA